MRLASLALLVVLVAASPGCTETLTEGDCARLGDRLRAWGQKKGKLEQKPVDDFLKTCAGSTVSRATARCLEAALDEASFFRCLE